jgi:hypothetical protein
VEGVVEGEMIERRGEEAKGNNSSSAKRDTIHFG